jgi:DNA-binding response OmpR family regulator
MHGLLQGRPHPEIKEVSPSSFPDERPPTGQAPKRILLVDDDPGVREMLGRVLEAEHYEVIRAKNGNEAGAKFVNGEPDLVLLDLNMPERDGWSAFRFMEVVRPLLPVIIITARSNQYAQAEELGVDALMEKPLNLAVLLEAIKKLLAETEVERMRRLTNPEFKTAFLNHCKPSPANGNGQ